MRHRSRSRLLLTLTLALGSINVCEAGFYSDPALDYTAGQAKPQAPARNAAPAKNVQQINTTNNINDTPNSTPVEKRENKEKKLLPGYFAISPYMPTYVLPYYYTGSPYESVYQNNTPNDEQVMHGEVKFQLSVKVPVWKNHLRHSTALYFAYTQLSYWQLYNHYAFFRETDYQPEFFIANQIDFHLFKGCHFDFMNLGAVHQSNGFGNSMERTWNRIYVEAIFSTENWMLSLKPWYIIENGSLDKYNPNIAQFLGYGRVLLSYKRKGQVFSLSMHNLIEGHARHATGELTWSFPLTDYIKGYVQVFSGYGQSLIEYNHRTNSAGLGLSLNDWI